MKLIFGIIENCNPLTMKNESMLLTQSLHCYMAHLLYALLLYMLLLLFYHRVKWIVVGEVWRQSTKVLKRLRFLKYHTIEDGNQHIFHFVQRYICEDESASSARRWVKLAFFPKNVGGRRPKQVRRTYMYTGTSE